MADEDIRDEDDVVDAPETEVEPQDDVEDVSNVTDPAAIVAAAVEDKPADAQLAFDDILRARIADVVADRREEMAKEVFADPDAPPRDPADAEQSYNDEHGYGSTEPGTGDEETEEPVEAPKDDAETD